MQKIQILLVEDHNSLRATFRDILEEAGYEVWPTASLEGVGEALREVTPALAIVDFRFPEVSGRRPEELGFKAQKLLCEKGVPIVGISLSRRRPVDSDLGEFGNVFLSKVADDFLDDLLAAVRRLLEGEVGGGE